MRVKSKRNEFALLVLSDSVFRQFCNSEDIEAVLRPLQRIGNTDSR